jgi:hypothetical protein
LATSGGRAGRAIRELRHYPARAIVQTPKMPATVVEEKHFGETRAQETIAV